MKISIVTPSFNSAIFIENSIKSVLDQHYENFEHIVIDGGSTDGTLKILKKYPHLKWISEPDEGQSDAINKGFKLATGDVIGWLNSDDVYLEGVFNKVVNELKSDEIDAVYANYYFTDEKLNIKRKLKTHKPVKWLSLFHCFIPSTTFFFKKTILDDGIIIDKDFHISMDKEFFAHIFYCNYKIKHIDKYYAKFRWHDENKSIDTNEVKRIRNKEGLIIFNRYAKFKLIDNNFGSIVYKLLVILLLIYRKGLKYI